MDIKKAYNKEWRMVKGDKGDGSLMDKVDKWIMDKGDGSLITHLKKAIEAIGTVCSILDSFFF